MGPNFDPERDIEDFSDDSSCEDGLDQEDDCDEDMDKFFERTFGQQGEKTTTKPATIMLPLLEIRRTVACIYMPIRLNCLYG